MVLFKVLPAKTSAAVIDEAFSPVESIVSRDKSPSQIAQEPKVMLHEYPPDAGPVRLTVTPVDPIEITDSRAVSTALAAALYAIAAVVRP